MGGAGRPRGALEENRRSRSKYCGCLCRARRAAKRAGHPLNGYGTRYEVTQNLSRRSRNAREHLVRQVRFRPINPGGQAAGAKPSEGVASVLDLQVGESGPFVRTTGGLYDTKRTLNVKVSNVHASKQR